MTVATVGGALPKLGAATGSGESISYRCGPDQLADRHQPSLDDLVLRDGFVGLATNLQGSAVRRAADRTTAAHAHIGAELGFDVFTSDPDAVGFRGVGLEFLFVDFLHFEHRFDAQWLERDGELGNGGLKFAAGIHASKRVSSPLTRRFHTIGNRTISCTLCLRRVEDHCRDHCSQA